MNPARREELHPLENQVVLGFVFKHCSFEDLKTCRQVSKIWRDASMKAWRSSVQVNLSGSSSWDGDGGKRMAEFLVFLQNENSNHLDSPFVTGYSVKNNSQLFWTVCGPSIKAMKLGGREFHSADVFRHVIFNSCPNLERLEIFSHKVGEVEDGVLEGTSDLVQSQFGEHRRLKSLTLSCVKVGSKVGKFALSWMELLSNFPSLELLRLNIGFQNTNQIFESICRIRDRDPQKLKLEHVSVEHDMNVVGRITRKSLFCALKDPRLGLVTLYLGGILQEEVAEVPELLKIHRSSLQTITLIGIKTMDLTSCFPSLSSFQLVNLQELILGCWNSQVTMGFLKFTPNLRKLVVRGYKNLLGRIDESEMEGVTLIQCKELEIWGGELTEDQFADDLKKLATWMPNIETLEINHLTNKGFAVVCERWPNLVSLRINKSSVDDCGITGLDPEHVARINKSGLRTRSGSWRPITVPRSNITLLKNLYVFHMVVLPTASELGVSSAVCGILQLSQLRHLAIERHLLHGKNKPLNPTLWKTVTDRLGI